MELNASAPFPTPGQILRGHGPKGWQGAGWDYTKPKELNAELGQLLLHYGQLAQATYDNLGLDNCKPTWGYATVPPTKILDYLTQDYPLAPGAAKNGSTPPGTNQVYQLPQRPSLSPVIYAEAGAKDDTDRQPGGLLDRILNQVAGLPVQLIGGARALFVPDPATGRAIVKRPGFMGFVAVSQPSGPEGEVDVAFVWRGTIFKEEWSANLAQDKLVAWNPPDWTSVNPAQPEQVGIHDGFQDLYLRPTQQPVPQCNSVPPEVTPKTGNLMAPRDVVHGWLLELFRDHNVTTITTTGHSLGGALSTISAFDIGQKVAQLWADTPGAKKERQGWATKAKPAVTAIPFAPPRVGNVTFVRTFSDELKVKQLRVCNVGDAVPKVPGLWVQLLTSVFYKLGINIYNDSDSRLMRLAAGFYYCVTVLFSKLWPSRWGYWHVGTILEIDSDKDLNGVGATTSIGQYHNLEVYLYLLSKKGAPGNNTMRNPLLLNKGDSILVLKPFTKIPDINQPASNWWSDPAARGYNLVNGRWEFTRVVKLAGGASNAP